MEVCMNMISAVFKIILIIIAFAGQQITGAAVDRVASVSAVGVADKVICDKRVIMLSYALANEVSAAIKAHYDKIFSDLGVRKAFSGLYKSQTSVQAAEFKQELTKLGFTFLKPYGTTVFVHDSCKHLVLKMARGPQDECELLNLGRVPYGHVLQHAIRAGNLPFKVSTQAVYFVPDAQGLHDQERCLPLALVVEELIVPLRRQLSLVEIQRIRQFCNTVRYPDSLLTPRGKLTGNAMIDEKDGKVVFIDTEPHGLLCKF
jgi:hypothetical protein